MKGRTDYTVEEIRKGIYRISEFDIANCYLIIGEKQAMLIDSGVGVGDLKTVIRSLTNLPIVFAATHAHIDHMGAARQIGKVYTHYRDTFCAMYQSFHILRRMFLKRYPPKEEYSVNCKRFPRDKLYLTLKPFTDGHEFDLGGRIVKAYLTPGHTVGSVCYRVENENIAFVGDSLIPCLNCSHRHASTLTKWRDSVESLLSLCNGCEFYGGHGKNAINHAGVRWQLETVKKIIAQTEKNDSYVNRKVITVRNDEHPHLTVVYRTDMVL